MSLKINWQLSGFQIGCQDFNSNEISLSTHDLTDDRVWRHQVMYSLLLHRRSGSQSPRLPPLTKDPSLGKLPPQNKATLHWSSLQASENHHMLNSITTIRAIYKFTNPVLRFVVLIERVFELCSLRVPLRHLCL